jgi:hypothetical protein
MRLINTKSLKLHEFFGDAIPKYAILSHTWGDGEINFAEWLYLQEQRHPSMSWLRWTQEEDEVNRLKSQPGYQKIIRACEIALIVYQQDWLWIDTNCIDKTNLTELTEAINAMWKWYLNSAICIAYLADVRLATDVSASERAAAFQHCRWFTRGWTLQELLAPERLAFFSCDWIHIDDKASGALSQIIEDITTIPRRLLSPAGHYAFLSSPPLVGQLCLADKMDWMSRRKTSRLEDIAYCMLGLFDINKPLIYGEGQNAFLRLQQEIISQGTDETFLLWSVNPINGIDPYRPASLLAPSPEGFGGVSRSRFLPIPSFQRPFFWTNAGLVIHLALIESLIHDVCFAVLHCYTGADSRGAVFAWIPLRRAANFYLRSTFPARFLLPHPSPKTSSNAESSRLNDKTTEITISGTDDREKRLLAQIFGEAGVDYEKNVGLDFSWEVAVMVAFPVGKGADQSVGLPEGMPRRWIRLFRMHGVLALRKEAAGNDEDNTQELTYFESALLLAQTQIRWRAGKRAGVLTECSVECSVYAQDRPVSLEHQQHAESFVPSRSASVSAPSTIGDGIEGRWLYFPEADCAVCMEEVSIPEHSGKTAKLFLAQVILQASLFYSAKDMQGWAS